LPDGVRDEYRKVFKTGKLLVTVETNEVAGRRITTETRKIPILENNKVVRVVTVIEDITERKKAEEELRKRTEQLVSSQRELKRLLTESEESRKSLLSILEDVTETGNALQKSNERFRDIAANTGDWIWETDEKGRYTYCSPMVKQVLGYEPNKVLGKYFYDFFHPNEREKLKKATFEVFEKKGLFKNFANRNVHKDGHTVILEMSGMPMLDDEGNLHGYRGVDRDVTERKQMEETIRESLHRSELLLDLMSHDLTNMNQMTLSSMELMLMDKNLPERAHRYGKLAEEQIRRSTRLISNVKKLTALRKKKLHLEKVDIGSLLETAISHLREDFPQRDIEVNFKSQKGKWFVGGANELLYDLFYNILNNAVKFDRHEKAIVDVDISSNDEFWRLEFRDRGPGIPDERKETVFLRARWKAKVVYGLGLGLALVRAIVERYRGRVWIEDKVKGKTEEGSNFIVLLPKAIDNCQLSIDN
jgi:PAS domain S-box-containing protein